MQVFVNKKIEIILIFFIFIEIIKRDVVVWKIAARQKENLGWSLR